MVSGESERLAFRQFLERLHPNLDQAGQEYVILRRRLSSYFRLNSCREPDDLADEVLERAARRVQEIQVGDVHRFLWGIAHRVRMEAQTRCHHEVPLDDLPEIKAPKPPDEEEEVKFILLLESVRICLERLAPEERNLIIGFYAHNGRERIDYKKNLARKLGISVANLRVKAHRVRRKLKKLIEEIERKPDCD